MTRLITYLRVPPRSFRYEQDGWGLHVNSNIGHLADELMDWRKGNNKPRSTFGECLEDVENFTAAGLNNDPRWVYDTDKPFRALRPQSSQGCSTCGARVA